MSTDLPPPSSKAAERLAVIVDAAERAALSVIDVAEKEAKRYLEEAQARADQLVAERLRDAADFLEGQGAGVAAPSLRPVEARAEQRPRETEERPPTPEEAAIVADPPEVASPPIDESPADAEEEEPIARRPLRHEPQPAPAAPRSSGSAGARLLATQMAVSGSSRAEIEKRLRNGFEIEDTREILDAILGPEE